MSTAPSPLLDSSIRAVSLAQRVSAVSFSSFLLVHLSAPLAASFSSPNDAEATASGCMLVGRELYQGEWTEPVLVWGSLIVHVVSGVARNGLMRVKRKERRKRRRAEVKRLAEEGVGREEAFPTVRDRTASDLNRLDDDLPEITLSPSEEDPSLSTTLIVATPPTTLHQISGYLMIPLLAHHTFLHRYLPLTTNLSTFFSFSFVSHSLSSRTYSLLSVLAYSSLTTLATYHTLVGIRVLLDPTAPKSLMPSRRSQGRKTRRGWQVGFVGAVAGVGLGLAKLAVGGKKVKGPEWIGKKYDGVLRQGWGM